MEDRNTVGSLVLHLAIACSLPCRVQVQFALGDGVPGADAAIPEKGNVEEGTARPEHRT
jgi:hypothetical protein